MQNESPMRGMWARYALFVVLSLAILLGNALLSSYWKGEQPAKPAAEKPVQVAKEDEGKAKEPPAIKAVEPKTPPAKPDEPKPPQLAEKPPAKEPLAEKPVADKDAEPQLPDAFITLGSVDQASPYRMLVTLTSRGAAVARIEMSSNRYHELEDRSGYLGHVVVDSGARGAGCPVQVVGAGTPADQAGLKAGDLIKTVGDQTVTGLLSLNEALAKTKPGETVELAVVRKTDGENQQLTLPVTLGRRPLDLVRPQSGSPHSFLSTLRQIDDLKIEDPPQDDAGKKPDLDVNRELEGLSLRSTNWEVASQDQEQVTFRRVLPKWGLELRKTYRLAKVAEEEQGDEDAKAYHLTLETEVRNTGGAPRTVAQQLDGPNGLPTEGWWYASKVRGGGLRDLLVSYRGASPELITCDQIGKGEWNDHAIQKDDTAYVAVDAVYFAAVMLPQRKSDSQEPWFTGWRPMAVGPVDKDMRHLTNVSFRFEGQPRELKPGEKWAESYTVFAGPKKPDLLAQYGLSEIVTYGWYGVVAKTLLWILHAFYAVTWNYGVAIILLTVVVRGAMFPLSRKQALNAQKMAELQPEIKKIQEKYKNNMEARGRAQQELFKKHNYRPLGGCLIVLLQLPIFVGLYRALQVDVELRQAPLISQSIRWASDLSAPDMLFDWSGMWHAVGLDFINRGVGMFGLGPYFNLLPILTIVLFVWQQKKFMPPPTDEQAAIQQKVMQFMMIFMGILFYKVATGLCLYFIASSLWSIAERQFLPKASSAASQSATPPTPQRASTEGESSKNRNRRNSGRR